jgi:hypothetical protein
MIISKTEEDNFKIHSNHIGYEVRRCMKVAQYCVKGQGVV